MPKGRHHRFNAPCPTRSRSLSKVKLVRILVLFLAFVAFAGIAMYRGRDIPVVPIAAGVALLAVYARTDWD